MASRYNESLVRFAIVSLLIGCDAVFGLTTPTLPLDAHVCEGQPFPGQGEVVALDGSGSVENVRFNHDKSLALLAISTNGDATTDLYQAPVVNGVIAAYSKMTGISSLNYDSYATYADPTHIVLASRRPAQTDHVAIWIAEAVNGSFDTPVITKLVDPTTLSMLEETSTNEPYTISNSAMYFTAAANNDSDLFRASTVLPLGDITRLDELDTDARENAAVVADDEHEIFFSSDRDQQATNGALDGLDIYTATRTGSDMPFDPPTKLAQISVADQIDYPVWLSADACELYYINKSSSGSALYVVRR